MKRTIEQYLQENLRRVLKEKGYVTDPAIDVPLERPKQPEHGDLSTNIALNLAPVLRRPAEEVAAEIIAHLTLDPRYVRKVEVAGPGFINFHLGEGYLRETLQDILDRRDDYGKQSWGNGVKLQVEFVSANPTGPLNVVNARAAAVGDVLVNLFNAVGCQGYREYYINDAGRQVKLLGMSVSSRYMALFGFNEPFPEEGYHGDYVRELAREIAEVEGDRFTSWEPEKRWESLSRLALEKMVQLHRELLTRYGVHFDVWFRESELRQSQAHLQLVRLLREKGYVYDKDGAQWFASSRFGDEKDRVLITRDGEPTYFLVDVAYHKNKYDRGFAVVYDLWGPDHHGYIPRMRAAILALGYPESAFQVRIIQQVNLLRGGQIVKMSKRAGRLIEMAELIDEVGVDAARFFFLMRSMTTPLDFDIDLAKEQTEQNPVYYVQYAHARVCNILRYAAEQRLPLPQKANLNLLQAPEEMDVIKKLIEFPEVISKAARFLEPHRLTSYLMDLAATFHRFYQVHRVVSEDRPLSEARLLLTEATRIVLANGLRLLGISAPERM